MRYRFLTEAGQIGEREVSFSDDQSHQIARVLRLGAGDQVRVFDGVTPRDLVVELIDAKRGQIVGERSQAAEPVARLGVYPALLQRDKFETVLQKLTEVGATTITPVITERSLVREPPDERRYSRWRAILREATEQSGRGRVPELRPARSFSDAVLSADGMRIVAFERERRRQLWDALAPKPAVVSLFVGPEGGFADHEAECARSAGAELITLGERVLRSETASPILAALVLYELERRA